MYGRKSTEGVYAAVSTFCKEMTVWKDVGLKLFDYVVDKTSILRIGDGEREALQLRQTVVTPDRLVIVQGWVVKTLNKLHNLHSLSVRVCMFMCVYLYVFVRVSVCVAINVP